MSYRNEKRGVPPYSANRVLLGDGGGARRHSYHVNERDAPPAKHPRLEPAAALSTSSRATAEDFGYDYVGKAAEKMFPDVRSQYK